MRAAMPLGPSPDAVAHARAFLRKWSLGRYLAARPPPAADASAEAEPVLVLSARDTVRDAMAALARRGVLSAPVLDERRALFLGFVGVTDIAAAFLRSDSRELLILRHQLGPEPGAPGDAALHAPATPGAPLEEFAERSVESLTPGGDGHLLFNAADPDYHALTLLDLVEGAFLHAGAPFWCGARQGLFAFIRDATANLTSRARCRAGPPATAWRCATRWRACWPSAR
jgi:CBS domain-containing protein